MLFQFYRCWPPWSFDPTKIFIYQKIQIPFSKHTWSYDPLSSSGKLTQQWDKIFHELRLLCFLMMNHSSSIGPHRGWSISLHTISIDRCYYITSRVAYWWPPWTTILQCGLLNPSSPGQNGRHFADDIFNCIVVNEKFCVLIKISLKFVP